MDISGDLLAGLGRMHLPALMAIMFLSGLVEVVFPPFPGDTAFIVGGFMAGRRGFPLLLVLAATFLGTYLAAAALFYLGRLWGRQLLEKRFFLRLLPRDQQARIESWFDRYGVLVVAASRFLPVVRSGIALAAGMAGVRPAQGLLSLAAGVAVFNTLLVTGGNLLGENWRLLPGRLSIFNQAAAAAVAVAVILWLWRKRRRSR